MVNFQKQFDVVTGTLNIFDLSYLVSGSAMMEALIYSFPTIKDFVYHKDQVMLSILICVVSAYVLGMISWLAGKQFRYWLMSNLGDKKGVDKDFAEQFAVTFDSFQFKSETMKKIKQKNIDVAYSYMWMKLDKSQDEDCRSRFLYISRFWVFRAIYEGLIPPVAIFSIAFYIHSLYFYTCECFCCGNILVPYFNLLICPVHRIYLGSILWLVLVFGFMCLVIWLLANEARRCANTQIREVIIAYYNFIDMQENVKENGSQTDNNK